MANMAKYTSPPTHTHKLEWCSALPQMECFCHFPTTCLDLQGTVVSDIEQTHKNKITASPHLYLNCEKLEIMKFEIVQWLPEVQTERAMNIYIQGHGE